MPVSRPAPRSPLGCRRHSLDTDCLSHRIGFTLMVRVHNATRRGSALMQLVRHTPAMRAAREFHREIRCAQTLSILSSALSRAEDDGTRR